MSKKIKNITVKVKTKIPKSPEPVMPSITANSNSAKITGFERVEEDATFLFSTIDGHISTSTELRLVFDTSCYKAANYYSDRILAEWCNRSDALNRKMRRWAAEHNEEEIRWEDGFQKKFFIIYNYFSHKLEIDFIYQLVGNINTYFDTYDNAVLAIAEFGDELKWVALNRPKWF